MSILVYWQSRLESNEFVFHESGNVSKEDFPEACLQAVVQAASKCVSSHPAHRGAWKSLTLTLEFVHDENGKVPIDVLDETPPALFGPLVPSFPAGRDRRRKGVKK